MTKPQCLNTTMAQHMYVTTSRQLASAVRPLIKKMVTKSFRMYLETIREKETQYGFLYFIHGDTIASEYTRGNESYFEEHYNSGIDKITDWLCEQLVYEPQALMRGSLKNTAYAFVNMQNHFNELHKSIDISSQIHVSIYQPVPRAYRRRGITSLMRLNYYPFPIQKFEALSERLHAFSYSEVMKWIHTVSQKSIQVSLHDAQTFFSLIKKQDQRLANQRYEMLDVLVSSMLESMDEDALLSADIPSGIGYIKAQKIDMPYFHYICRETFSYAKTYLKDDLYSYASSIVFQLDNDFVHHGLGLDAHQLAYLLDSVLALREGRLLRHEHNEEPIFKDEAVQRLLRKYHRSDQLHTQVHQYRLGAHERTERKVWFQRIASICLPNRVRKAVMDNVLKFNELHMLFGSMDIMALGYGTNIERQCLYDYDGYFAFLAQHFLECGGNVKHVLKAYQHFSLPQKYLSSYDLGEGKYFYTYNGKLVHDFYEVMLPSVVHLFNALRADEIDIKKRKDLSNAFLKAMVTYNLESTDALGDLASQLRKLKEHLSKGVLSHPHVLKNIDQKTSLNTMLSLCTQANMIQKNAEIESVMETLKQEADKREGEADIRLTWDHLKIASNMTVQDAYLDLYRQVLRSKNLIHLMTSNPAHEVVIETEHLNVGVYTHNNPIGVLGAGVKGVCIALNSHYRQEQLHPAFMNLCVHDDKKVLLWGLLCRASNSTETVYILNNLQGSINAKRNSKYDVRKLIINALQDFVKDNNIDAVLIRDQSFNAINLAEGQKQVQTKSKKYLLGRRTRLDFSVQQNGIVDEDGFYLIN